MGHLRGPIELINLTVQGAKIIGPTDTKKATGKQPNEARAPFTQIEPVDTEIAQEGLQDPRDIVVILSGDVAAVGLAIHAGNQKEVDNPTDEEESAREKPDHAGNGAPVIKSVRSREAEDPEKVTDGLGVGVVVVHVAKISLSSISTIAELIGFYSGAPG